MRRIVANLAVSLDQRIEGPHGEYDWCFTDQDYGMTEFLASIDTILFGRRSYEAYRAAGQDLYPGKGKYVVSSRPVEGTGEARWLDGPLVDRVSALKEESGRDIWLFGGAGLLSALLRERLVDEMILSLHPIILGEGKPLLEGIIERIGLTVRHVRSFDTGLVQITYAVNGSR